MDMNMTPAGAPDTGAPRGMDLDELVFVDTGEQTGAFNMDFDVHRAEQVDAGAAPPMLRVYNWKPWCISLGRYQKIEEIDQSATSAAGYDIVRRPTGGRAILHAEELTYSVVMPSQDRGIMEVYRLISEALTAGLQQLVPEIDIAKSQPNFQKLYKEAGSIPCFSSSARYEIEYGGKKLVGSAQRRIGGTVLQHGSILIGEAHLALADFLAVSGDVQEQLRHDMRAHTTTLQEVLGRQVFRNEVRDALIEGFRRAWGVRISISTENEYISATESREFT
ncbi:MAG: lipoate--protein ligase family protein [Bacteroidetes bacterium]|nr:lipoate--protein ligase family protein [Bacteroidota bacterium]